jgi:chemotaxis response regulator CheB
VIRVLMADDQALVRARFKALLDAQEGIEVVGEAVDGEEAIRLARALRPDVVLMDIRMPGLDGPEATRAITADELLAGVRIVILTTFDLDEYVFEALRGQRVPGQEHRAGRPDPRGPGGRLRRRPALPGGDPAAGGRVRHPGP